MRSSSRHFLRWGTLGPSLLLPVCLVSLPGCPATKPATIGDTQVGQGKLYQSTNASYDQFFEETHTLQMLAMGALDEEARTRAPLAKSLQVVDSPSADMAELAKARARKLAGKPV